MIFWGGSNFLATTERRFPCGAAAFGALVASQRLSGPILEDVVGFGCVRRFSLTTERRFWCRGAAFRALWASRRPWGPVLEGLPGFWCACSFLATNDIPYWCGGAPFRVFAAILTSSDSILHRAWDGFHCEWEGLKGFCRPKANQEEMSPFGLKVLQYEGQ